MDPQKHSYCAKHMALQAACAGKTGERMELNARMICILQEVVEARDKVTVDQICSRNDISKRTFYYDIKNVNAWLREKGLPEIALRSGSCTIDAAVGDALGEIIRQNDTEYFMSVDERKIMMAMYIGLAQERVRIHDFCDLFDISKNTVLSDMKSIRRELAERHITLRFETERGYFFHGNEYAIRNYLYGQFKKVRSIKTGQYIRRFLNEQLAGIGGVKREYWESLKECLVIYEEAANTSIVENDTDGGTFILTVSYLRHAHGHLFRVNTSRSQQIRTTRAYKGAENLFRKIEEYVQLPGSEQEICYVALCFLAMQNFDPVATEGQDPEMLAFTERFLTNIEASGMASFSDRNTLKGRLVNHIAPMIYRITYGVQLDNPIADSVKRDYKTAFELARQGICLTDEKLAAKITEDELSYLAIYIADGIKSELPQGPHSGRILVVCPEGVATALLIRDQLESLLESHYVYDLTSVKNVTALDLSQYLLIVTAAKGDLPPEKTVRVGLFLSEENKRSILERLDQEKIEAKIRPREIMAIIRRHCGSRVQSMTDLNIELLNYINAHRSE